MFCIRSIAALVALVCLVALEGCVERRERLSISPNGSVLCQVNHSSDSLDDLYEGDAVPMIAGGWAVEEQAQRDDDGKETYRLVAQAGFAPGVALPQNFALRNDRDADLYLQFPTSLTFEERSDGTYFHFSRVYQVRPWAQIALLEERYVKLPMADFSELDAREWSENQRETAIESLAAFETEKALTFARAAFLQATPQLPQDAWLLVQQHLHECLRTLDVKSIAKLLEPTENSAAEQARGEAIQAEARRFEDATLENLKHALKSYAGYDGLQFSRFMTEYDRQKKRHDITQDLGDDRFEIVVEMPGEIVASNADEVAGRNATWTFDGQIIRDRTIELMVTSRVAR